MWSRDVRGGDHRRSVREGGKGKKKKKRKEHSNRIRRELETLYFCYYGETLWKGVGLVSSAGARARESDKLPADWGGGGDDDRDDSFQCQRGYLWLRTVSWVPYPGVAMWDGLGNLFIRVLFVPVFILETRSWKSFMEVESNRARLRDTIPTKERRPQSY